MLHVAILFGVLALFAGALTTVLRRSVKAIEAWIKPETASQQAPAAEAAPEAQEGKLA